jgi:hypothetical protein
MKKIKLLIAGFVLLTVQSISAQDFSKLSEIQLTDTLSCAQAQPKVIECCNFLLANPCTENIQSLSAMKFLLDWMSATPKYNFTFEHNLFKSIKADTNLTARYYAALAKCAIENNYIVNSMDLQLKAITLFIGYCEKPDNGVKITVTLQKYIDAIHANNLKDLIIVR